MNRNLEQVRPKQGVKLVKNIFIYTCHCCINSVLTVLMTLKKKPFENIVGKGENAGNQHFLFFPQCILPVP